MSNEGVFTLKLDAELLADFMAETAGEDRPASQVMHGLMRAYIQERRQTRGDYTHLQRKVEAGRVSMQSGHGRSNEEVEAAFVRRREKVEANRA